MSAVGLRDVLAPHITEPGQYELSDAEYHADPVVGGSVSSSVLRRILAPGTPASVRYQQGTPRPATREMELGTAVHTLALRSGRPLVEVQADSWQTARARQVAGAARAAGKVPLLTAQLDQARAMAAAVRDHPTARDLIDRCEPEQTLIWRDQGTGLMCRAMVDGCPDPADRPMMVDLKTTESSAHETAFAKSITRFRYDQQDAFYRAGFHAVHGVWPDFVFIVVEVEPPHLVNLVRLTPEDVQAGYERNSRALDVWAECVCTGNWPGYGQEIAVARLPRWSS